MRQLPGYLSSHIVKLEYSGMDRHRQIYRASQSQYQTCLTLASRVLTVFFYSLHISSALLYSLLFSTLLTLLTLTDFDCYSWLF